MASCLQVSAESILSSGSVPAPAWTVGLFGMAIVCSGTAYFFWRARRKRRGSRWSAGASKGR